MPFTIANRRIRFRKVLVNKYIDIALMPNVPKIPKIPSFLLQN